MWLALFILVQIFLWLVVGGILTIIILAPIFIVLMLFELLGKLTINNLLLLIHRIPLVGPIFSGLIATGIGVVLIFFGLWVWVNYIFIMLRCIGGPNA